MGLILALLSCLHLATFESEVHPKLVEFSEKILLIYNGPRGGEAYTIGEAISQKEHALQAAELAQKASPNDHEMIIAALLHDIGQLIYYDPDSAEHGINNAHEVIGYQFLLPLFGKRVATAVLNHVNAKRYLVAADPSYYDALSPASQHSLKLQGGPYEKGGEQYLAFEADPYFQESIQLRCYDDGAKVYGQQTLPIESYQDLIIETAYLHLCKTYTEEEIVSAIDL